MFQQRGGLQAALLTNESGLNNAGKLVASAMGQEPGEPDNRIPSPYGPGTYKTSAFQRGMHMPDDEFLGLANQSREEGTTIEALLREQIAATREGNDKLDRLVQNNRPDVAQSPNAGLQ